MDSETQNEASREFISKGKLVPRDAGVVYLYELQNASHSFRGFSMEEMTVLVEHFPIVSFAGGTQIIRQGDHANFVIVILQGTAHSFIKGQGNFNSVTKENKGGVITVDNLQKGDFVGQNAFFTGGEVEHPHYVQVTACINIVMMFTFDQLTRLNSINPHCGNRVMRLTAEAASERIYAPTGVPAYAPVAEVDDKVGIKDLLSKFQHEDGCFLQDFSEEDIDLMLDHAGLVRYDQGTQVFYRGHQARMILVLLSGEVETRGSVVWRFNAPGSMVGESFFPFIIHKNDAFAAKESTFLTFTCESIYRLNMQRSELGFKLTRNIIQGTLSRMHKVFRPGGIAYDPEKVDLSSLEKELVELRWVSEEGMHGVLKEALMALSGSASDEEVKSFWGRSAVTRLTKVVQMMGTRLTEKDQSISEMVKVKDHQKLEAAITRLTDTENNLKSTIKNKDNKIENLEFIIRESDAKYASLQKKLDKRGKDVEELEGLLEEEKRLGKERWKMMQDQVRELQKNSSKSSDFDLTLLMKDQQLHIQELKKQLSGSQDAMSDLKYENNNLQDQVRRQQMSERRARCSMDIRQKRIEEAQEDLEEEFVDETIPRLQEEVAELLEGRAMFRWKSFAMCLLYKRMGVLKWKPLILDMVREMQYLRSEAEEKTRFKTSSEELQGELFNLGREQLGLMSSLKEAEGTALHWQGELEKRMQEIQMFPEMQMMKMRMNQMQLDGERMAEDHKFLLLNFERIKSAFTVCKNDIEKLGDLGNWMIWCVLDFEASGSATRVIWRNRELSLLKSCWAILTRRKYLTPPASNLNIKEVADILTRRGKEEFQGSDHPIPALAFDRSKDGLFELIASAAGPNHALKRSMSSMAIPKVDLSGGSINPPAVPHQLVNSAVILRELSRNEAPSLMNLRPNHLPDSRCSSANSETDLDTRRGSFALEMEGGQCPRSLANKMAAKAEMLIHTSHGGESTSNVSPYAEGHHTKKPNELPSRFDADTGAPRSSASNAFNNQTHVSISFDNDKGKKELAPPRRKGTSIHSATLGKDNKQSSGANLAGKRATTPLARSMYNYIECSFAPERPASKRVTSGSAGSQPGSPMASHSQFNSHRQGMPVRCSSLPRARNTIHSSSPEKTNPNNLGITLNRDPRHAVSIQMEAPKFEAERSRLGR